MRTVSRYGRPTTFNVWFDFAQEASNESDGTDYKATAAAIFSCMGSETFINELIDMSRNEAGSILATISQIDLRTNIRSKFRQSYECAAGKKYNVTIAPYADFSLLIDLRNATVHYSPDNALYDLVAHKVVGELGPSAQRRDEEPLLTRLQKRGLIPAPGEREIRWLNQTCTRKIAEWSIDTSIAIVHSIIEVLPTEGNLKSMFHFYAPGK